MSAKTLREVYTQFGESTKRDSDDFNGMLGFGSKSAVAYTNTFTIEAVKDGRKTIAVVTRKENFSIVLKLLVENMETNERNGVKIQIPVNQASMFAEIARSFYKYWKPGTVLIDGKEPDWAVGDEVGDGVYYTTDQTSYVVMGNVAYRINNPRVLFPHNINFFNFVAYVPNGAVEFTPNREDLKYSEHTKKALNKVIKEVVDKIVAKAKADIHSSTTHWDAYTRWSKWRRIIGNRVDNLVFKGVTISEFFLIDAISFSVNSHRYNTATIHRWPIDKSQDTYIITDFGSDLSTPQKKKTREWLTHMGHKANHVLFTQNSSVSSPWIDPARVVSWEKVKAEAPKPVKKPRVVSTAPGRLAGTFDTFSAKVGYKSEQDVPVIPGKTLYYISVQKFNSLRWELDNMFQVFGIDTPVVIVPANRLNKFLRNYTAEDVIRVLSNKINLDGPSLISSDGQKFLNLDTYGIRNLNSMDETKVDDPVIKDYIRLIKTKKTRHDYLKEYDAQERLARTLGKHSSFKKHGFGAYGGNYNPLEKYSLVTHNGFYNQNTRHKEHSYIYMNTIYKLRKDGANV
jgi:hypothetical protein